jgi:transcriptional regulator with XRE-family HTH domain
MPFFYRHSDTFSFGASFWFLCEVHMLSDANEYLNKLIEVHERSGLSYREVAQECDLDPSYVHYILKGARRPHRDVLIALGFAYRLDRWEVDELLLLAGLPPIGRSTMREYRQDLYKPKEGEEE